MKPEHLPPPLRGLAARGQIKRFPKDSEILQEGTTSDGLYILLEGKVRAFASDFAEREITFDIDQVGDYFGEMALDGGMRSASICALEPTVCVKVPFSAVWDEVESSPVFARALIVRVIGRARRVTEQARKLALMDVRDRLLALIESMAQPIPGSSARRVPERLTHLDIAARIGASREMVSRCMKELRDSGVIMMQSGTIVLLQTAAPKRPPPEADSAVA